MYGAGGPDCGIGEMDVGLIAPVPEVIFRTSPGISGDVSVAGRVRAPSLD